MSTYNTNNPVEPNGSTDPRDLYDNAQNLDIATNSITRETWLDRLNRSRKTWFGMEQAFSRLVVSFNQSFNSLIDYLKGKGEEAVAAIGWQELGDWSIGLTINNRDQVVWYDNAWYKYIGTLPHTIAGSTPATDGGIWSDSNPNGKWVNIGDAALRSELKRPAGVYLVGGAMPIWRVGDYGGVYSADADISNAFNLTADAKGSTPGTIVLPSVAGVLYVSADSLRVPKNTILDLQGNTIKLSNSASKYVIRNRDESTFGGFIQVENGIIDGNRPGGQTRRFDTPTVNAGGLTIYDYRTNYPGFTLMFSNVEKLTVTNVHVKDAEAWSIAHFKCGDALFDNCSFDATEEIGKNADGITGVGTRRTEIRHLRGYTNDDMCAISTNRATLGQYAIFDPNKGANAEAFTVNGLLPIKKGSLNPHVGVGVYVSDNFEIDAVTIRDVHGYFYSYVARFGNYWKNSPYNAPNGIIHRVQVENAYATSYTISNADLYFFETLVYHAEIKGFDANKNISLIGSKNRSPLVQAGSGASISYLKLDNCYYFNNSEPLVGKRHSVVDIVADGAIKNLTVDLAMDFSIANVDKNTILGKHDAGTTTLEVIRASLGGPSNNNADFVASSFNEANLFINDGGGAIRIGACFNFKMRKDLTLINGVTPGSSVTSVCREGTKSFITGYVTLPTGYTQGTPIATIPQWAIPYSAPSYPVAVIGDSMVCRVRVKSDGISVYPSPSSGGALFLDGVSWESGIRLSYTP
ncbi:hypothetical protein ABQ345_09640 [Serratia fonticola]|uniref:hypothetical protein n=1 Tax=Serratia fonticola TaxID=47917 RepID=UPI003AAB12DD